MSSDRLLFKFYKSYFDVANELSDKDRLAFYDALINRQFFGIEPNLKGMANFAYISQKHNIDSQVKGWEDKMKCSLQLPDNHATIGGVGGGAAQLKEKEKEEEKIIIMTFDDFWKKYPVKVGKDVCRKKFESLSDSDLQTIKDTIDDFVKYKPFDKYNHPNPSTYLNQKRWFDELSKNESADVPFKRKVVIDGNSIKW